MTTRGLGAVAMVAALVALAGCGEDADTPNPDTGETVASDVHRYCQLVEELGRAGDVASSELPRQNARRADLRDAERRFLQQNEEKLDEVVAVAPGDVKGATETFVEGLRTRAGLIEGHVDPQTVDAASQGVNEFHQRHCEG